MYIPLTSDSSFSLCEHQGPGTPDPRLVFSLPQTAHKGILTSAQSPLFCLRDVGKDSAANFCTCWIDKLRRAVVATVVSDLLKNVN